MIYALRCIVQDKPEIATSDHSRLADAASLPAGNGRLFHYSGYLRAVPPLCLCDSVAKNIFAQSKPNFKPQLTNH
jgi:hypothetical protein